MVGAMGGARTSKALYNFECLAICCRAMFWGLGLKEHILKAAGSGVQLGNPGFGCGSNRELDLHGCFSMEKASVPVLRACVCSMSCKQRWIGPCGKWQPVCVSP